jgi:hypothetical protein
MSTYSRLQLLALLGALAAFGQADRLDNRSTMHITLPDDSPVAVLGADWGESRATARGGAMVLDLRTSLTLRNASKRRIRGVTLLVVAQEVTPGGKASTAVPSLDIGPGEAFPVRIDLRLLRPLESGPGPLVDIGLDGVLFDDFSFYGPNKLNSQRSMTVWELEAQRDRRYFKTVLEHAGVEGLRHEMIDALARLSERPKVDMQVARGRATNSEPERGVRFAFLRVHGAPVETEGQVMVSGNQAWSPKLDVRNRGDRPVRHVEIGWVLYDNHGEEFYAGSVPADLNNLAPGTHTQVTLDRALTLTPRPGQTLGISRIAGFVNQVEFADGRIWIPDREALRDLPLKRSFTPSPEEQRLTEMYRKKGLQAVVDELRKF